MEAIQKLRADAKRNKVTPRFQQLLYRNNGNDTTDNKEGVLVSITFSVATMPTHSKKFVLNRL